MQCALDEVNKAFEQAKVPYPKEKQGRVCEETRFEKGLAVQQQIFGKEHINAMREAAPAELKHIQDYLSAYSIALGIFIPERRWIYKCAN